MNDDSNPSRGRDGARTVGSRGAAMKALPKLDRTTFSTSRLLEFCSEKETLADARGARDQAIPSPRQVRSPANGLTHAHVWCTGGACMIERGFINSWFPRGGFGFATAADGREVYVYASKLKG
jgi:hypothetical protein